MSTKSLVLFACLFVSFAIGTCIVTLDQLKFDQSRDKFAWCGVVCTFFAAIAGTIVGVINVRVQTRKSEELEYIKNALAKSLEESKLKSAIRYDAYKEAMAAAVSYQDALSRMQNGRLDQQACELAEAQMMKSWGIIYFLPKEFEDAWEDFRQHARYLKEACGENNFGSSHQMNLWKGEKGGGQLGVYFKALADSIRAAR